MDSPIPLYKTPENQARYFEAYGAALKLWPVPYISRYVNTLYGQIHIVSCGPEDALPLVLLHGGYASSTMWFPNVADLSKEYRVLALDTIGEPGLSTPTRENATRRDCAGWIESVLDELSISKTHVVGLSRGGWLALNLAIHAPQRLDRIVLLSPAASFVSLNKFFKAVSATAMRIRLRSVLKAALYSWVTPGFKINPVYTEQFCLGLYFWNWEVNANGYSGVMPSAFSAEELSQVHIPILMLIGDHDRLNRSETIEQARQTIPQIEAEIVPNAGHLLSMEQPRIVDAQVLEFLAVRKNG
jgi:pimeloyl-ACP methyl ester carboxylesterase